MTSLLPPNATPFERAMEAALVEPGAVPVPIETTWQPDTLRADLLPYLAYGLSVDNWSPEWPEAVRRERIRRAIAIQRRKGTAESVRAVVASLGGALALREWWQTVPRGLPHSFALILSIAQVAGGAPSPAYIDSIIDEIRRTKPVRSRFTFTLALTGTGAVRQVATVRPATYARLTCAAPAA